MPKLALPKPARLRPALADRALPRHARPKRGLPRLVLPKYTVPKHALPKQTLSTHALASSRRTRLLVGAHLVGALAAVSLVAPAAGVGGDPVQPLLSSSAVESAVERAVAPPAAAETATGTAEGQSGARSGSASDGTSGPAADAESDAKSDAESDAESDAATDSGGDETSDQEAGTTQAAAKARPAPPERPDEDEADQDEAEEDGDGPTYTAGERERIETATDILGTDMAETAYRAASDAGIPYYVALAFLQQETGGGANVFGHDPTIYAGAGQVTKEKYLRYKEMRQQTGEMQGVGPMQLTWYSYQDWADRLGGAWKPYVNMLVGFRHLANLYETYGSWYEAARAYNGSGPMAEAYAAEMRQRFDSVYDELN